MRYLPISLVFLAFCLTALAHPAYGQNVTTGSLTGTRLARTTSSSNSTTSSSVTTSAPTTSTASTCSSRAWRSRMTTAFRTRRMRSSRPNSRCSSSGSTRATYADGPLSWGNHFQRAEPPQLVQQQRRLGGIRDVQRHRTSIGCRRPGDRQVGLHTQHDRHCARHQPSLLARRPPFALAGATGVQLPFLAANQMERRVFPGPSHVEGRLAALRKAGLKTRPTRSVSCIAR